MGSLGPSKMGKLEFQTSKLSDILLNFSYYKLSISQIPYPQATVGKSNAEIIESPLVVGSD